MTFLKEEKRRKERERARECWSAKIARPFFIALGNVSEPSGNVAGQLVRHNVKHNVIIRP